MSQVRSKQRLHRDRRKANPRPSFTNPLVTRKFSATFGLNTHRRIFWGLKNMIKARNAFRYGCELRNRLLNTAHCAKTSARSKHTHAPTVDAASTDAHANTRTGKRSKARKLTHAQAMRSARAKTSVFARLQPACTQKNL